MNTVESVVIFVPSIAGNNAQYGVSDVQIVLVWYQAIIDAGGSSRESLLT